MVEKCREIAENDPELERIRSNIEENLEKLEDFGNFNYKKDVMKATSLRLTQFLEEELDKFVGRSNKFRDRSALVRAVFSRFFNENDPVSAEFRSFFE